MENQEYRTKDLYLASYLQLKGFEIIKLEKNDKRFTFIFQDSDGMHPYIEEFYARKAQVEPMEYSLAMKQVKSKLYNFT